MNRKIYPLLEEINDNMITENRPDKFIYRARLFEILDKYLGSKKLDMEK